MNYIFLTETPLMIISIYMKIVKDYLFYKENYQRINFSAIKINNDEIIREKRIYLAKNYIFNENQQ